MKIILSILLNASILFLIWFLLNNETHPNAVIVTPEWIDAWKTYLLWWIILWVLNITIKPILKLISLPLFFIYPIISVFINWILLWLISKTINEVLTMQNMTYQINWWTNFAIAVAIFTILNILYSLLFNK